MISFKPVCIARNGKEVELTKYIMKLSCSVQLKINRSDINRIKEKKKNRMKNEKDSMKDEKHPHIFNLFEGLLVDHEVSK